MCAFFGGPFRISRFPFFLPFPTGSLGGTFRWGRGFDSFLARKRISTAGRIAWLQGRLVRIYIGLRRRLPEVYSKKNRYGSRATYQDKYKNSLHTASHIAAAFFCRLCCFLFPAHKKKKDKTGEHKTGNNQAQVAPDCVRWGYKLGRRFRDNLGRFCRFCRFLLL